MAVALCSRGNALHKLELSEQLGILLVPLHEAGTYLRG